MAAIRPASLADVPALVALENRSFAGDRVSARSFRHLVRRRSAAILVEEEAGTVRGYALLLFRRGSRIARLYSFAVGHEHRGQGLAKALLAAAEGLAGERGARAMRLELRQDNAAALALYRKLGYAVFGSASGYYEDGMDAVRMEKPLLPVPGAGKMLLRENCS